MATQISDTAGLILIDLTQGSRTILLPSLTSRPGRVITIKDQYGYAVTNPLIINVNDNSQEQFESGASSYTLVDPYGFITIISDPASSSWRFLGKSTSYIAPTFNILSTGVISSAVGTFSTISTNSILAVFMSSISTVGHAMNFDKGYINSAYISSLSVGFLIANHTSTTFTQDISYLIADDALVSTMRVQDMLTMASSFGTVSYLSSLFVMNLSAPVVTIGLSTLSTNVALANSNLVSSVQGLGTASYVSSPSLTSSIEGLGSVYYVSSLSLVSTVAGLGTTFYISSLSLTSTTVGLGSINYVSTLSLISTTAGLGMAGYVSTLSLRSSIVSTTAGLGSASYVSSLSLTSTSVGLGTAGYVSSLSLLSTTVGLGNTGYVSSLSLFSTVAGLGLTGYVSTSGLISVFSSLSTVTNLLSNTMNASMSSLSSQTAYNVSTVSSMIRLFLPTISTISSSIANLSNVAACTFSTLSTSIGSFSNAYIIETNLLQAQTDALSNLVSGSFSTFSTLGGSNLSTLSTNTKNLSNAYAVVTSTLSSSIVNTNLNLISSVGGLGTAGYVSSLSLVSTVAGLGTTTYVSSLSLVSTVAGLGTTTYVSSPTLYSSIQGLGGAGYVSTLSLTSSIQGLGQTYTSTLSHFSTTAGLGTAGYVSTLSLTSSIVSTVAGLGTTAYVSSLSMTSTSVGLGLLGYVSSLSLVSTATGLGQTYVSTSGLASTVSSLSTSIGLLSNTTLTGLSSLSTFVVSSVSTSISVLSNFTTQNLSTVSTSIGSNVSTLSTITSILNLATGVSLSSVSSGLVSSGINLISSVAGLGQTYISTLSLISTVSSLTRPISSMVLSTLVVAAGMTVSTLAVNQLTVGDGNGWLQIGAVQTIALSSVQVNTGILYATSTLFGNVPSQTVLQFYGLQGNYNNTAIAELSTGVGTQELLFFRGSSTADRIRVTTTGDIRFEPGYAQTLFNTNSTTALSVPTMLLRSNLVGIGTSTPASLLDVAGIGRFQTLSSLSVLTGTLLAPAGNISTLLGRNISSFMVQTSSVIATGAVLSSLSLTEGAVQNGLYVQNNVLYFTSTPITGPSLTRFQYITLS